MKKYLFLALAVLIVIRPLWLTNNPITVKVNSFILEYYFKWFTFNHLSNYDLTITSTYRTPQRNESVGGAKNSAHLYGIAYDFVIKNENGTCLSKNEVETIFKNKIKPHWLGFCLNEGDHIHVNLPRIVAETTGIIFLVIVVFLFLKLIF